MRRNVRFNMKIIHCSLKMEITPNTQIFPERSNLTFFMAAFLGPAAAAAGLMGKCSIMCRSGSRDKGEMEPDMKFCHRKCATTAYHRPERCRNLWIVKIFKIYCTFLSIGHYKEKGTASLSICQVCKKNVLLVGHFHSFSCRIFFITYWTPLPPPVVHYTVYPPSGISSKYLQIWTACSSTIRSFGHHQFTKNVS